MSKVGFFFSRQLSVLGAYLVMAGLGVALAMIFAVTVVQSKQRDLSSTQATLSTTEVVRAASDLVHQLQVERGMSAVFVASKGSSFGPQLRDQRAKVDDALTAFRTIATASQGIWNSHPGVWQTIERDLAGLADQRLKIDALAPDAGTVLAYITALNAKLISFGELGIDAQTKGSTAIYIEAMSELMRAKDAVGLERAVGSRTFTSQAFANNDYEVFVGLIAASRIHLDLFARTGGPVGEQMVQALLDDPASQQVNTYRTAALGQAFEGITSAQFFDAQTAKLGLMRGMEERWLDTLATIVSEDNSAARAQLVIWLIVSVGGILVIGGLAFGLARQQNRVIQEVVDCAGQMSAGNLNVIFPEAGRNSVSVLIRNLAQMRDNIRSLRQTEQRTLEEQQRKAEELLVRAEDDRRRAAQIANDLEGTAAASTELNQSLQNVLASIRSADSCASSMRGTADRGTKVVHDAIEAMERISVASSKIGSIMNIINDIAFQTNLLALNARVEAARAGAAGRGFAVVASEVQQLAAKSSKAAQDVGILINQAAKQIETGVSVVQNSGEALTELAGNAQEIAALMEQITTMSSEQSTAISDISKATSRLDVAMREFSERAA